jgi:Ca2+-binding EF-hand superfamily protein
MMLLRYVDHNGNVTRAAMEAGLKKDFDAADTNHDGMLEPDEMRAVNEKRWNEDQAATSPLVDWNHKGYVDFDDFAATARSLFDQLDTNGDGVLTPAELKPKGSGPGQGEKGGGEQRGHGGRGGGADDGGYPDQ